MNFLFSAALIGLAGTSFLASAPARPTEKTSFTAEEQQDQTRQIAPDQHGNTPIAGEGPRYDVGAFDVAGIRLGMGANEVRSLLRTKGFLFEESQANRTFATEVKWEARRRNQPQPAVLEIPGPASIEGRDSSRNLIRVDFVQLRTGPVVAKVELTFDGATNNSGALEADMQRRYGTPTRTFVGTLGQHWCDRGSREPCEPGSDVQMPKLTYIHPAMRTLILSNWSAYEAQRQAELAAVLGTQGTNRQLRLLGS